MPIVSGNVSLYNETDGRAILPTPTIGAVGLIEDLDDIIGARPQAGDVAVLLGETRGHLGQSALLAEAFGIERGEAPPVDLAAERRHGSFVRAFHGLIRAATDLSDGGLALAAFEMAAAGEVGVALEAGDTGFYFGEDQARYLLAVAPSEAALLCDMAGREGVPCRVVGSFGGPEVRLGEAAAPLAELLALWRGAFAAGLWPARA
jgi:phosphoribosylformylglycinamidine synthase